MKRFVLSIAAFVGLVTGCQAASPSFSSFYTNHFTTNGLVIKANLNPTQFDTNSSSITITITNVSGISGGSHWTNPIGVLQPRSGQTTNALLFISASSDNATNSAFTVDTVNTWTDIDARLIQGRIQGTNLFGVSPFGTVSVGRGVGGIWYAPDESDVFAGVRDASLGESEYAALHFAAIDHQDATNYATFTKTLRSGANASGVSTFRAAIDGLISEVAMHVQPSAGVARLEVENMGDTTFSVFDNAGTFVHNMLWAVDGFAMVPSLTTNLVAGVNELETMNEGVILLTGPTTNPADTIVNLGDGNGVGNFFVLINNAQNSAFTLQDGDPLWDNPLAFQRLNGNWVSTNRGDSIWLFNNGWFITEIGRISGNTNVSAPVVMNPTDLYVPYRQAEGVFADSPMRLPSTGSTNAIFNGAIYVGPNSYGFWGASDYSVVSVHDVDQSEPNNNGIAIWTVSGNLNGAIDGNVTTNQAVFSVGVANSNVGSSIAVSAVQTNLFFEGLFGTNNPTVFRLHPTVEDLPENVAYRFDTPSWQPKTSADLARFQNAGTNMVAFATTNGVGMVKYGPGDTNVVYKDGLNLIYEGAPVVGNTVSVGARRGSSTAYFGVNSAGGAFVQSASNRAILDVGGVQAYWDGTNFLPDAANKNLGTAANPWSKVFVAAGGGNGVFIQAGTGDPNGVVTANVGSLWLRTDGGAGSTLYVKESGSGSAGWAAK